MTKILFLLILCWILNVHHCRQWYNNLQILFEGNVLHLSCIASIHPLVCLLNTFSFSETLSNTLQLEYQSWPRNLIACKNTAYATYLLFLQKSFAPNSGLLKISTLQYLQTPSQLVCTFATRLFYAISFNTIMHWSTILSSFHWMSKWIEKLFLSDFMHYGSTIFLLIHYWN